MKKFAKFLSGGAISYGIKLGVTFLLTDIIGIWYILSYGISMILVILFGFFYNFYFVFRNIKGKKNKLIVYTATLLVFTVIDIFFVKMLTDNLNVYYLASIIISTTTLVVLKFLFYKGFVFIDYSEKGGNYYDKHRSKNPLVKYLMRKFHKVLFSSIKKTKARTILDVGCGEGDTTALIKRKFPKIKIRALEYDKPTLKKAQKAHPKIDIGRGNIYKISSKNNSFDSVTALEVLEHLEKPEKAIKEAKRVSKKYCIFSVPYEPFWRIANIIRISYLPQLGNTPGHIQHWTKSGFRKMLEKHFKNVKIKNCILWNFALCWD